MNEESARLRADPRTPTCALYLIHHFSLDKTLVQCQVSFAGLVGQRFQRDQRRLTRHDKQSEASVTVVTPEAMTYESPAKLT